MKLYHTGFPMERIHLDVLGPFTMSNSGNTYVLMMCHQFSKWLECSAIPDQKAETVAEQFLTRFVATFGCPVQIHTDQGKNFESDLCKAFCERLGVAKTRTTPYHPSSNGQVESQNRIVLQMIRCLIQGDTENWDQDLPLITMTLHAMVNRNNGFTANQIMLGREVIQPASLVMGSIQSELQVSTPGEWVKSLTSRLQRIHNDVRQKLKANLLNKKKDNGLRLNEAIFEPGDLVYERERTTKKGLSPKLQPVWKWPFLIVKAKPPLYLVITRKREKYLHHNNLKRCEDRELSMWLRRARNKLWAGEAEDAAADQEDIMAGTTDPDILSDVPVADITEQQDPLPEAADHEKDELLRQEARECNSGEKEEGIRTRAGW